MFPMKSFNRKALLSCLIQTNAHALITLFARSGSSIGQPAVERSHWAHLTWPPRAGPASGCALRYVPFVEVSNKKRFCTTIGTFKSTRSKSALTLPWPDTKAVGFETSNHTEQVRPLPHLL
jgi:hypothetical protein